MFFEKLQYKRDEIVQSIQSNLNQFVNIHLTIVGPEPFEVFFLRGIS